MIKVLEGNEVSVYSFEPCDIEDLRNSLSMSSIRLGEVVQTPVTVFTLEGHRVDIGNLLNAFNQERIVPEIFDGKHSTNVVYQDPISNVYINVLGNFDTLSTEDKLKVWLSKGLRNHIKAVQSSDGNYVAKLEQKSRLYKQELLRELRSQEHLIDITRMGYVPTTADYEDILTMSDTEKIGLHHQLLTEPDEAIHGLNMYVATQRKLLKFRESIITAALDKREELVTFCYYKTFKDLSDLSTEVRAALSRVELTASDLFKHKGRLVLWLRVMGSHDILTEFFYEPAAELYHAFLQEHAELVMDDAVAKVVHYGL